MLLAVIDRRRPTIFRYPRLSRCSGGQHTSYSALPVYTPSSLRPGESYRPRRGWRSCRGIRNHSRPAGSDSDLSFDGCCRRRSRCSLRIGRCADRAGARTMFRIYVIVRSWVSIRLGGKGIKKRKRTWRRGKNEIKEEASLRVRTMRPGATADTSITSITSVELDFSRKGPPPSQHVSYHLSQQKERPCRGGKFYLDAMMSILERGMVIGRRRRDNHSKFAFGGRLHVKCLLQDATLCFFLFFLFSLI